jgi:ssDNA-binding Zn-finger/Zn-ribbon topoisomerase 1
MLFPVNDTCPNCRRVVRLATIELHPSIAGLLLHTYHCPSCGPVRTKPISTMPDVAPPEAAA